MQRFVGGSCAHTHTRLASFRTHMLRAPDRNCIALMKSNSSAFFSLSSSADWKVSDFIITTVLCLGLEWERGDRMEKAAAARRGVDGSAGSQRNSVRRCRMANACLIIRTISSSLSDTDITSALLSPPSYGFGSSSLGDCFLSPLIGPIRAQKETNDNERKLAFGRAIRRTAGERGKE